MLLCNPTVYFGVDFRTVKLGAARLQKYLNVLRRYVGIDHGMLNVGCSSYTS